MATDEPRVRLTGAERRRDIIAAAQAVFASNGLGGARTSQIAEAAGVAESLLYRHFASKRELFEAAVTLPVAEFVESVVDSADGLLDGDGESSERFYRSFVETMTEVLPLLGVALFSDAEEGRRFYNTMIVPLSDRYEAKVRRSLVDVGTRVDAGFLARAVIGMMFLLALDANYRDGATPLRGVERDLVADRMRSFVAGGLAGSGADDLLAVLAALERADHDETPAHPSSVSATAWAEFWAARRENAGRVRDRMEHLEQENETLRRVVADQAIELRRFRDLNGTS